MTTHEPDMVNLTLAQPTRTIGEMVLADYRKAEVFRKYAIDYCCGGKKSLEEACRKKGLDAALVQSELDQLDLLPGREVQDFDNWPLDTLADYIVENHHRYVEASLPMLYELSAKVARVHGDRHAELIRIARIFNTVGQDLQMHMHKEEGILFPHIRQIAISRREKKPVPVPMFGSVANPIQMMEAEHESAGGGMEEIRQLTNDFTPPMDACMSYRVLFAKLQEFEQDLHQHVHLENNLLFPKAIALEKQ